MDYWTVSHGIAVQAHKCRECKKYVFKGQPIAVRDGRKLRFFYHPHCFSGISDIRTQDGAMKNVKAKHYSISKSAPKWKGVGKWSVDSYGYQPSKMPMKCGTYQQVSGKEGKSKQKHTK